MNLNSNRIQVVSKLQTDGFQAGFSQRAKDAAPNENTPHTCAQLFCWKERKKNQPIAEPEYRVKNKSSIECKRNQRSEPHIVTVYKAFIFNTIILMSMNIISHTHRVQFGKNIYKTKSR